jgi:molybdopterin converting factor small subunit
MADATSEITLEFHGALAERFASLGYRRGTRTRIDLRLDGLSTVATLLQNLVAIDPRYAHLFDVEHQRFPEHIEAVLNDRAIELVGGLDAPVRAGDVLAFLPAHAGG